MSLDIINTVRWCFNLIKISRWYTTIFSTLCAILDRLQRWIFKRTYWPAGLMVRRCSPKAKIAGSIPASVEFFAFFFSLSTKDLKFLL